MGGDPITVTVIAGRGRFAYWSNRDRKEVIADATCNHNQRHFAGKLGSEWTSTKPGEAQLYESGFVFEHPGSVWSGESED